MSVAYPLPGVRGIDEVAQQPLRPVPCVAVELPHAVADVERARADDDLVEHGHRGVLVGVLDAVEPCRAERVGLAPWCAAASG